MTGYVSIKTGENQTVVACGQESMSLAAHVMHLRSGLKLGDSCLIDTLISDGLTDAFHGVHMGITGIQRITININANFYTHLSIYIAILVAENISKDFNISREEQDEFAAKSQQKVEAAVTAGYFKKEIIPVTVSSKKESIIVDKDEFPKFGTTVEKLQRLKPAFLKV